MIGVLVLTLFSLVQSDVWAQSLTISTISAGSSSGQPVGGLGGIAVDAAGNLYIADSQQNAIKKITAAGILQPLAGSSSGASGNSDGTGANARFDGPAGIAVDATGVVYVADRGNNAIRKITPAGVVTTLSGQQIGAGQLSQPSAVAVDAIGNLYIVDSGNYAVKKMTPNGIASIVASIHTTYGWLNGIAVDGSGNIFVSDGVGPYVSVGATVGTNTIDKISPLGAVTVLAGQQGIFGAADGPGASAQFNEPMGLAVDAAGDIFVADEGNNAIRKITPAGTVTTVAGGGKEGFADGTGAQAQFNLPEAVVVDSSGTAFIADSDNKAVRRGIPAANTTSPVRFINMSTRGTVGPSTPMIAGFVITGSVSQTVLVRAVGPTLQQYGVPQPLVSPQLDLVGLAGAHLASSADGINTTNVQSAGALVGAFPLMIGGTDAAMVISLSPGAYTAEVSSQDGTSGSVLVEVYEVP